MQLSAMVAALSPIRAPGLLIERQIGMVAAEDYHVVVGRLFAVCHQPETPPNTERIDDDGARLVKAEQDLDRSTGVVGFPAAAGTDKAEPIIQRLGRNWMLPPRCSSPRGARLFWSSRFFMRLASLHP